MSKDDCIRISSRICVPRREIHLSYARSGGPGGQNVNKVASKAVLRFDLRSSPSLPEPARARALARLASRLTVEDELVLWSQAHREQSRNREAVIERFRRVLSAAVAAPKKRRPTAPSKAAREKRLGEKKARGQLKRQRARLDE